MLLNLLSGLSGIAGALLAYVTVEFLPSVKPYVLTVSSASLLYIAMSDLIPDLHRGQTDRNSIRQVALIAAGILTVLGFEQLAH
jgi:zinc and cadmium transporter